jgi:hypothetical protein
MVDIDRVVHDKAKIAGLRKVSERLGDTSRQAFARQRTGDSQAQPGPALTQGGHHRRGLRKVTKTVGGDINVKMRICAGCHGPE